MKPTLAIKLILQQAWLSYRNSWKTLFFFTLVLISLEYLVQFFSSRFSTPPLSSLYLLFSFLIFVYLELIFLQIALSSARGKIIDFVTLKSFLLPSPRLFFRLILTLILTNLILILGLIIIALPFFLVFFFFATKLSNLLTTSLSVLMFIGFVLDILFFTLAFIFSPFLIIDDSTVTSSLKTSLVLVKPHLFQLFLFILALLITNFLGLLVLGIGLLVTIPTTLIALALAYLSLINPSPVSPSPVVSTQETYE